jgi:spoIIIJ-associated protein
MTDRTTSRPDTHQELAADEAKEDTSAPQVLDSLNRRNEDIGAVGPEDVAGHVLGTEVGDDAVVAVPAGAEVLVDDGEAAGAVEPGADVEDVPDIGVDEAPVDDADDADADESDRFDDADDADDSDDSDDMDGAEASSAPRGSKRSRAAQLEREGEVAADFLETLLDIADLDGDIEVDIDGDRAAVAIVDSEEGPVPRRLVGAQGKVLEALQELTRLAVQTATGERSRLMLDVAGHRAERRTTLVRLAKEAIAEVKVSGTQRALDDMTAFERKVVHDEVAAAGLESESEGVEPHRHIVILPG